MCAVPSAPGAAGVRVWVLCYLRSAYRLIFDVTQPYADRYPELVRCSTRARRTTSVSSETLVKAGVFHGDPELLGLAFLAATRGLVILHMAGKRPGEHDFESIRREVMRLLVIGARAI